MMKSSVILLGKEEEKLLNEVIDELLKCNLINEIIVVTDDRKINIDFERNNIKIKTLYQKEKGYGSAIVEGYKEVKNSLAFIFNGDGSFDPKSIEEMMEKSKDSDFVFASRYLKNAGSDDDTIVTYVGNKIFSLIGNIFFGIKINDILYTYVLCNVKKFNELRLSSKDFRLCVEMPIKIKNENFSYTMVASRERSRKSGYKKVNAIKDGFLILTEMIKLFFKKNDRTI